MRTFTKRKSAFWIGVLAPVGKLLVASSKITIDGSGKIFRAIPSGWCVLDSSWYRAARARLIADEQKENERIASARRGLNLSSSVASSPQRISSSTLC